MLRNFVGVLIGLFSSLLIIMYSLKINHYWIPYDYKGLPLEYWKSIVDTAKPEFFIALAISSGVACFIGGLICAIIVSKAKTAYAMLIGFILLLFAIYDVLTIEGHPWWYILGFGFIFFPCSWLGAATVQYFIERIEAKKNKNN